MAEEGLSLEVGYNEFDEEPDDGSEQCRGNSAVDVRDDINQNDVKHAREVAREGEPSTERNNYSTLDYAGNLTKIEDGEISNSSEDENVEKMDVEEENDGKGNLFSPESQKAAADFKNFSFLPHNPAIKVDSKSENFEPETVSGEDIGDYESEGAICVGSDISMDDQSWKRHKRAKLEDVSNNADEMNAMDDKGEEKKKTRGGRKKRKRPLRKHNQHANVPQLGKNTEKPSANDKLFKPLNVTAADSENAVAREIAYKLSESKTMLIERVVECIGCEKAIKLFQDTQEVERHGGMYTKEKERRRTSGGVFLVLLKHRYVTKEQEKWIFALENEIVKRKAKEEKQRLKELHIKNVSDLRLKLRERDKEGNVISQESK
ncbi:uncharacterized protein [Acropora muricata]|uniref:uncharacterized protein n=1 Tax=Acropora muricata TaxID=159855 RepID=UPI0034E5B489